MSKPYLSDHIGERVIVDRDSSAGSTYRESATLVAIRRNGHRVRFDDGTERTVAWWRLSKEKT